MERKLTAILSADVEGYSRLMGEDVHPGVAMDLNNLGLLYTAQGKYAEAAPLYKRALAMREKALGPKHLAVAASLSSLANLYLNQGKYSQAEPLIQRAREIRAKHAQENPTK